MKKLIELWKNDCEHCEAVKPIVEELEKEGFTFKNIISRKKMEKLYGMGMPRRLMKTTKKWDMSKGMFIPQPLLIQRIEILLHLQIESQQKKN